MSVEVRIIQDPPLFKFFKYNINYFRIVPILIGGSEAS
jgi:hypothetical protein